jgi:hypothetical protein
VGFVFRGHNEIPVCFSDRPDQEALLGSARNNGRTRFPAFQESFGVVEVEFASDLFGAGGMAFVAMIDKGWPDPALEKLQVLFPGREFAHYPGPE